MDINTKDFKDQSVTSNDLPHCLQLIWIGCSFITSLYVSELFFDDQSSILWIAINMKDFKDQFVTSNDLPHCLQLTWVGTSFATCFCTLFQNMYLHYTVTYTFCYDIFYKQHG